MRKSARNVCGVYYAHVSVTVADHKEFIFQTTATATAVIIFSCAFALVNDNYAEFNTEMNTELRNKSNTRCKPTAKYNVM